MGDDQPGRGVLNGVGVAFGEAGFELWDEFIWRTGDDDRIRMMPISATHAPDGSLTTPIRDHRDRCLCPSAIQEDLSNISIRCLIEQEVLGVAMASMMSVRAFAEGLNARTERIHVSRLDELIGVLKDAAEIAGMDLYAIKNIAERCCD